jgi:hypothetical protein
MQKMLLIGEVAYLSKEIEEAAYLISQENYRANGTMYGWDFGTMKKNKSSDEEEEYDDDENDEEEEDSTIEGEALAIEESFMVFDKEKEDSAQRLNKSWMKYRKDTGGSSCSDTKSHRTIQDPDPESMAILKQKQEQKEQRKQKEHDIAAASLEMFPVNGFNNVTFLPSSERKKIFHLLEKWEEPEIKIKMV